METLLLFIIIIIAISYFEHMGDRPSKPTPKRRPRDSFRLKSEPQNVNLSEVLMTAREKRKYLNSSEWADKRVLVIVRDKVCQCCGSVHANEVHHISYLSLGKEPLSDLVLVCRKCHQEIHDKYGYDRLGYFPLD